MLAEFCLQHKAEWPPLYETGALGLWDSLTTLRPPNNHHSEDRASAIKGASGGARIAPKGDLAVQSSPVHQTRTPVTSSARRSAIVGGGGGCYSQRHLWR